MRLKVSIVVVFVALLAVGLVSMRSRGSDPSAFPKDFRAAVKAQVERTKALQDEAKDAIGSESSAVFGVYRSMLEAARTSLASYEWLRAPDALAPKLEAVVGQARAEVRAVERVVEATSSGSAAGLTDGLKALAGAMADRAGAIQLALGELDRSKPDVRTEEAES